MGTLSQDGLGVFRKGHPGTLIPQRLNPLQPLCEYQQALPEPTFANL